MFFSQDVAYTCCASRLFADLVSNRNYSDTPDVIDRAREVWWKTVPVTAWLEAFAAHPRIGDFNSLKKKYQDSAFQDLSRSEQGSALDASQEVLQELAEWNAKYEDKFGHVFIICASGQPANQMLAAIKARFGNDPYTELRIAAAEQMKITELRIWKLSKGSGGRSEGPLSVAERRAVGDARSHTSPSMEQRLPVSKAKPARSPITTHVLDTARGRPAAGVPVRLDRLCPGCGQGWRLVAAGTTNKDGRIGDLMPPSDTIEPGTYRMTFEVAAYMERCFTDHPDFFPAVPFYPTASVTFQITAEQIHEHFHVPLTWSPYGYSTYRGS